MIVKSVYYGAVPIACVYMGGRVIWQARDSPQELSLSHDAYLNVSSDSDVSLLPAVVLAPYHDDSGISHYREVASGMVLSLSEGVYIISLGTEIDGGYIAHPLPAQLGNRDTTEQTTLSAENSAVAAPLAEGWLDRYFYVYLEDRSDGVAAEIKTGDHEYDVEVLSSYYGNGTTVDAKTGAHGYGFETQIVHRNDGVAAEIKNGALDSVIEIRITRRNDGVAAGVEVGAHESSHEVLIAIRNDGVAAGVEVGAHESSYEISNVIRNDGTSANAETGYCRTELEIQEKYRADGVASEAKSGVREAEEESYSVLKGQGHSLDIVNLSRENSDYVYNVDESYAETVDVAPGLCEKEETVESSLFPTGVQIVSGTSCTTCVCYTNTFAALSDRPEYVYPVQTDTDLYIPQVLGVTPNGTGLILKPTT